LLHFIVLRHAGGNVNPARCAYFFSGLQGVFALSASATTGNKYQLLHVA
jgi:hypothetical protein